MCETALCDTITQDNVLGTKILTLSHVSAFLFAWSLPTEKISLLILDLLVLADLHGASAVRGLALKVMMKSPFKHIQSSEYSELTLTLSFWPFFLCSLLWTMGRKLLLSKGGEKNWRFNLKRWNCSHHLSYLALAGVSWNNGRHVRGNDSPASKASTTQLRKVILGQK